MEKHTIFIEGIPGSGKSTLLNSLHAKLPRYHAYREGDLTPLELAWCACMTPDQYDNAIKTYPKLAGAIASHTQRQGPYRVTAYTQIPSQDREFYAYMEQYEIYGGRRCREQFQKIVLSRFQTLPDTCAIYECALLQNILEELMLFACSSDSDILAFYQKLFSCLDPDRIRIIRLLPADPAQTVDAIRRERIDGEGKEVWYTMMLGYLCRSPYGKAHAYQNFDDVIDHFRRRITLEDQILALLPASCRLDLASRQYTLDPILHWLGEEAIRKNPAEERN